MNLIWITPELPWPANTGGRIGIMKRIEYFAINNSIYLYSIIDSDEEKQYVKVLKRYCKSIHLYNRNNSKFENIAKCFKGPYICSSRWKKEIMSDIDQCFKDKSIDYVIVDFPQMLGNLSKDVFNSGKVVLNQHNLEANVLRSNADTIKNIIKRKVYMIEAARLEKLEQKYYNSKKICLYTFVSREDKKIFEDTFNVHNTLLVPVGIDINSELAKISDLKNDKVISFIGKMSYPSNVKGAIWFVNNVWPRIVEQCPEVRLYLVGKDPVQSICDLANENVIVTGTVDSVQEYYEKSSLIIIPLLSGGGVKVKLMEAFSYKKIVVSTTKGVEGTDFENGKHLLVEDNPKSFADSCIKVLNHRNEFEDMAACAFDKAVAEYSWKGIVGNFESYLLKLMSV